MVYRGDNVTQMDFSRPCCKLYNIFKDQVPNVGLKEM